MSASPQSLGTIPRADPGSKAVTGRASRRADRPPAFVQIAARLQPSGDAGVAPALQRTPRAAGASTREQRIGAAWEGEQRASARSTGRTGGASRSNRRRAQEETA